MTTKRIFRKDRQGWDAQQRWGYCLRLQLSFAGDKSIRSGSLSSVLQAPRRGVVIVDDNFPHPAL